jgi:hypothetical protein
LHDTLQIWIARVKEGFRAAHVTTHERAARADACRVA